MNADTLEPLSTAKSSNRWAVGIAAAACAFTMVPYLVGSRMADGRSYLWLGENFDDGCVYLSWMRQAATGRIFGCDLFTTDDRAGALINPLFILLGGAQRLTGLPPIAVYHLGRLAIGFALLLAVWRLIGELIAGESTRKLSFLFVCFSAGLGWLPNWWLDLPPQTPIDKWQGEAITFQSIYLNPLFPCGMLLEVATIGLLFQSCRTRAIKPAIGAGLCGLLLGLVHTYDVITVAAVIGCFVLAESIRVLRSGDSVGKALTPFLHHCLVAALVALPGAGYVYFELHSAAAFRARANVETLSPAVAWVILGYGLTLALALAAFLRRTGEPESEHTDVAEGVWAPFTSPSAGVLLAAWMFANLAVAYAPASIYPFQRKLIEGAHIPIAILAGVGAVRLLGIGQARPKLSFGVSAVCLTALLSLTNVRVLGREIENDRRDTTQTGIHRPYILAGEMDAFSWIVTKTRPGATVQPIPWLTLTPDNKVGVTDLTLACATPAFTGHAVYCGHFGETPGFGVKLGQFLTFVRPSTTDEQREAIVRAMGVRYLVFSQKDPSDEAADRLFPMFRGKAPTPSYLTLVYSNRDADIYEITVAPRQMGHGAQ